MKAILSLHHPADGAAPRAPEVHGVMPPGLTLLGFRDGQRLAFRDAPLSDRQPATGDARASTIQTAKGTRIARFGAARATSSHPGPPATSTPHSGGISSGLAMPSRMTYQHSLHSAR